LYICRGVHNRCEYRYKTAMSCWLARRGRYIHTLRRTDPGLSAEVTIKACRTDLHRNIFSVLLEMDSSFLIDPNKKMTVNLEKQAYKACLKYQLYLALRSLSSTRLWKSLSRCVIPLFKALYRLPATSKLNRSEASSKSRVRCCPVRLNRSLEFTVVGTSSLVPLHGPIPVPSAAIRCSWNAELSAHC
jgi:hypothetical protein